MSSSEEGSLDINACSCCHLALDFSDLAAFDAEDRQSDYKDDDSTYYFRPTDPYVPKEYYDPHNALVYCETCDRMFHQKCHFVPVLSLPKQFICLVCQMKKGKTNLFRSPPDPVAAKEEAEFEVETVALKRSQFLQQIHKLQKVISNQFTNDRQAQITIDTLTSEKNHKHSFTQQMQQSILTKAHVQHVIYQRMRQYRDILYSDPQKLVQFKEWARQQNSDYVARILFPFGMDLPVRMPPRTPELNAADDESVSIDELACALCHESHATDENDLVMCDGAKCCRAFHVKCAKISDKEMEDDDWFCFICKGLADLLSHTQALNEGEDWEQRRIQYKLDNENASMTESLKSWSGVSDVFPEAPIHYKLALAYSQGKKTTEIEKYVSEVLGMNIEFDLDDEDEHYESDEESSHSSASDDVPEIELQIAKAELDALSDVSGRDDENSHGVRRTRRRSSGPPTEIDIGKLDERNILLTSRKRKAVDYQKLNNDLFGSDQNSVIDDEQEFKAKRRATDSSSNDSDSDSQDGSTNSDGSDNESETGSGESESHAMNGDHCSAKSLKNGFAVSKTKETTTQSRSSSRKRAKQS